MEALNNLLKTVFNIDNNTSATLIVTLSIFILGFLLTGIIKSFTDYRYRRNYRMIFKQMINEIVICTRIQANSIRKLITLLNIENEDYFTLEKHNINLLNNFNQIPFDIFYSSYFKGPENICKRKKLTAFNKAFGLIDSLTKNEKQILIELNNCVTNFNKHSDKWNDSAENVRLNIENIRLTLDGKDIHRYVAEFFNEIEQIVLKWQSYNNRSHYNVAYSQLIRPILDLYNKNKHNDIVLVSKLLLDSLMDSDFHYINMCKSLDYSKLLFSNFEFQYRYTSRVLRKINEILN